MDDKSSIDDNSTLLLREEGKYIRSRYIHYDGVPHYEQPRQN